MIREQFALPSGEYWAMEKIPYAQRKTISYESFSAWCPHCGHKNDFNRRSDLNSEPVDFTTVRCGREECLQPFHMNGDWAGSSFELLFWECYEHIESRKYGQSISTLVQAYERFFCTYAEAELIWKPDAREDNDDLERANHLRDVLWAKLKACGGFHGKRSFVLWHLKTFSEGHATLDEADLIIQDLRKHPEPGDESLQFQNQELANAVLKLEQTNVNEIRNSFEHEGYQPPREKAEKAVADAREILLTLGSLLEIHGDVNLYSTGTSDWGISRARMQ